MTYQETDLIAKIDRFLTHAGIDATDSSALNAFDQYHAGGADAVDLLIASLHLTRESTLLDVGAGFGGPARQIATRTGARVFGVDITASYVETATWLTKRSRPGRSGLISAGRHLRLPAPRPVRCGHHHARADEREGQVALVPGDRRSSDRRRSTGRLGGVPFRQPSTYVADAVVPRRDRQLPDHPRRARGRRRLGGFRDPGMGGCDHVGDRVVHRTSGRRPAGRTSTPRRWGHDGCSTIFPLSRTARSPSDEDPSSRRWAECLGVFRARSRPERS